MKQNLGTRYTRMEFILLFGLWTAAASLFIPELLDASRSVNDRLAYGLHTESTLDNGKMWLVGLCGFMSLLITLWAEARTDEERTAAPAAARKLDQHAPTKS